MWADHLFLLEGWLPTGLERHKSRGSELSTDSCPFSWDRSPACPHNRVAPCPGGTLPVPLTPAWGSRPSTLGARGAWWLPGVEQPLLRVPCPPPGAFAKAFPHDGTGGQGGRGIVQPKWRDGQVGPQPPGRTLLPTPSQGGRWGRRSALQRQGQLPQSPTAGPHSSGNSQQHRWGGIWGPQPCICSHVQPV